MTYFETKAKLALRELHADETQYAALAKWAEEHKGKEEETNGVIVTRDGRIVAETVRAHDRGGRPGATYVKEDSTDIKAAKGEVLDFALGTIRRELGEQVCHIPIWDLTQGSGQAARSALAEGRMPGSRLKATREAFNLSVVRLAGRLGVTTGVIHDWEKGRDPVPYKVPSEMVAIGQDLIGEIQAAIEGLEDLT